MTTLSACNVNVKWQRGMGCVQLYSFIILLMSLYIFSFYLINYSMYTLFAGVCGDVISFSCLTA